MGMTATTTDSGFTEFVREHTGSLRHTAYLLVGNDQAADDLLQDALVKTWTNWERIDQQAAWAFTRKVMVNLATDRWRRKRYEAITAEIDDRRPDPGAGSGFSAAEDRSFILEQLSQLSPRERAIIVLRYYDDLSEADVAQHVGVTVGTVKSTCSRALARLRSRLEGTDARSAS